MYCNGTGGVGIFCTRPDRTWGPPSLQYNGYRVFAGVKAALTTHSHLAPSLRKPHSYTSIPLWAFVTCSRVKLTFTFTFYYNGKQQNENKKGVMTTSKFLFINLKQLVSTETLKDIRYAD
jgi:hypothetical protein